MRRLIQFPCAGETLVGTLDEGTNATGLLIVSGGNEIRCGAHRGMALLAARLAATGIPVFRFDRRGIGDSTGENCDFESAAPDIAAAAATFCAETGITRLVAFGNCDAATALALFHEAAGMDALVLANPWIGGEADDLPPAAAIRARYAQRLRDPASWRRLLAGRVDLSKLANGLRKISSKRLDQSDNLSMRLTTALAGDTRITVILATGDATAIAYDDAVETNPGVTIHRIDTASHSFARAGDMASLEAIIRSVLTN
ncbi:MAG: hydrolase 1, exosortase A system-associated [Pseudomonadota bacterium]|nr:hydrolase 1, exosortase A system-associated [Pseudomonadota bacterium]